MWNKTSVFCLLLLTTSLGIVDATEPGLVGYWNFDDNTTSDLSGNANNGILLGGANLYDDPEYIYGGQGYSLDLNFQADQQYMLVEHSASFESIVDELTITLWIRPDLIDNYDGMVCKSDQDNGPVPWALDFDDANHPNFRVNRNIDPNTGAIGEGTFTADTEVALAEWTFVGFTSNGEQVAFVVNDQVTTDQQLYRFGPGTDALTIGADLPGGDEYFNGLLDEIKIYNVALTTRELVAMSGMATKPFGPDPADGQIAVSSSTLTWGSIPGNEKVYLGTDPNALSLVAENTSGSYTLPDIVAEQTYYWRVDVDETVGDLWAFTAAGLTPLVLSPDDGYPFVAAGDLTLAWLGALGASSYKVYLGTGDMDNLPLLVETSDTATSVTDLPVATQYYWRVDAVVNDEVIEGTVWSFKTAREVGGLVGEYRQDNTGADNFEKFLSTPAMLYTMAPTTTRVDETIDFGWGFPEGIGPDFCTVRWRGIIEIPYDGMWTFIIRANDGTRVFLNDVMVWEDWSSGDAQDQIITLDLKAGFNAIRFEYFEERYNASCSLEWEHEKIARKIVPQGAFIPDVGTELISPALGAEDVAGDTALQWIAVEWGGESDLYLGTNPDAVANATKASPEFQGTQTSQTLLVSDLEPETTYYWRADGTVDGKIVKGRVWSFTTSNATIIDDMEAYNPEDHPIWGTWLDGLGPSGDGSDGNGSGAQAGDTNGDTEKTLVHGGIQALPLNYDLDGEIAGIPVAHYAEISTAIAAKDKDWTDRVLSLWYHGLPKWDFAYDVENDIYSLTGAGRDIWTVNPGTEQQDDDEFLYVYTKMTGNGEMVCRVDERVWNQALGSAASQLGVMFREDLDDNSMFAMSSITGDGRMLYRHRDEKNASVSQVWGHGSIGGFKTLPIMLKIVRQGNTFSAYLSEDEGATWVQRDADQTIPMSDTVYIGLACTPHIGDINNGKATLTGLFSRVSVQGDIEESLPLKNAKLVGVPMNDLAPIYVAVEDGSGKRAIIVNDDAEAVRANKWALWQITDDQLTGIDLTNVARLAIGVGDSVNPVAGGQGALMIDDISLDDE